jgi:hypothetical protein
MREGDIVRIYCSIYNKNFTNVDIDTFIYSDVKPSVLMELVDDVITMNVITKDFERAYCLVKLVTRLRELNQIPVYRFPSNGIRKKILNLSDWCNEVQDTIYSSLAKEVRSYI